MQAAPPASRHVVRRDSMAAKQQAPTLRLPPPPPWPRPPPPPPAAICSWPRRCCRCCRCCWGAAGRAGSAGRSRPLLLLLPAVPASRGVLAAMQVGLIGDVEEVLQACALAARAVSAEVGRTPRSSTIVPAPCTDGFCAQSRRRGFVRWRDRTAKLLLRRAPPGGGNCAPAEGSRPCMSSVPSFLHSTLQLRPTAAPQLTPEPSQQPALARQAMDGPPPEPQRFSGRAAGAPQADGQPSTSGSGGGGALVAAAAPRVVRRVIGQQVRSDRPARLHAFQVCRVPNAPQACPLKPRSCHHHARAPLPCQHRRWRRRHLRQAPPPRPWA